MCCTYDIRPPRSSQLRRVGSALGQQRYPGQIRHLHPHHVPSQKHHPPGWEARQEREETQSLARIEPAFSPVSCKSRPMVNWYPPSLEPGFRSFIHPVNGARGPGPGTTRIPSLENRQARPAVWGGDEHWRIPSVIVARAGRSAFCRRCVALVCHGRLAGLRAKRTGLAC